MSVRTFSNVVSHNFLITVRRVMVMVMMVVLVVMMDG